MGTYNLSKEEIKEPFKKWLNNQEGDVMASVLAEVWNELAEENFWQDRLKAVEI